MRKLEKSKEDQPHDGQSESARPARPKLLSGINGLTPVEGSQPRYATFEDKRCPACGCELSPLTYVGCKFCLHEIERRRSVPHDPITTLQIVLQKARALKDVALARKPFFLGGTKRDTVTRNLERSGQQNLNDLWQAMENFSSNYLMKLSTRKPVPHQPQFSSTVDYGNAVSTAEAWIIEAVTLRPDLRQPSNRTDQPLIDFNSIFALLEDELERCNEQLKHPSYQLHTEDGKTWVKGGDLWAMSRFWLRVNNVYRSLPDRFTTDAPKVPENGFTYPAAIEALENHLAFFRWLVTTHPELTFHNSDNLDKSLLKNQVEPIVSQSDLLKATSTVVGFLTLAEATTVYHLDPAHKDRVRKALEKLRTTDHGQTEWHEIENPKRGEGKYRYKHAALSRIIESKRNIVSVSLPSMRNV